MKKRIFVAFVVLAAAFAMVGCPSGDGPGNGPAKTVYITISFDLNYEALGASAPSPAPTIVPVTIEQGASLGNQLPTKANNPTALKVEGWGFTGWETAGGDAITEDSPFAVSTTLFATWVEDTITLDLEDGETAELVFLQNGAAVVYQFDIPAGKTLGDYDAIDAEYKVSALGLDVWDKAGLRHVRLYGVYTSATPTSIQTEQDTSIGPRTIRYYNVSGSDSSGNTNAAKASLNTGYLLDTGPTASTLKNSVTADEWFKVTYDTTGDSKHADFNAPDNLQADATGTVYFALGLSCQKYDQSGRDIDDNTFIQLIKNITLYNSEDDTVDPVFAKVPVTARASWMTPGYEPGQFLANNDPIIWEWRGEATDESIADWRTLVPRLPQSTADRGPEPANLQSVELFDIAKFVSGDIKGFTYINRGNPNNQRGWASFTEAGRANDQAYSGDPSDVAFENFKDAWYLVLETEKQFTGGAVLIWMGGAGGWNSNSITSGDDGSLLPATGATVTGDEDTGYVYKFPLATSLGQPGKFYNDNTEWAAFCIQYWGNAPASNVAELGIKKATLLVGTVTPAPTGISAGISFSLGDAPAGGAIIDDVALNTGGTLVVKAVRGVLDGISDYRWYVNGVYDSSATDEVFTRASVTANTKYTVTLQAKIGGKWVSQTVFVTVNAIN